MTTPNPNLSELRRLAEGARDCWRDGQWVSDERLEDVDLLDREDREFIAACDPATILALLDMVENAPTRDTET